MAAAAVAPAEASGGLVDPTLLDEIEAAGYHSDRLRGTLALPMALALAPPRAPAGPHPDARWRAVEVDLDAGTITRPLRVKLDGGGIVKGLCADVVAESLRGSFAVNCEGRPARRRRRACDPGGEPFDGAVLHEYAIGDGARPDRVGGRGAREGGGAQRPGRRSGLAPARRRPSCSTTARTQ